MAAIPGYWPSTSRHSCSWAASWPSTTTSDSGSPGNRSSLPATAISLIFLAYLSGTVSARWAAGLTSRFGRRTVLIAGTALMAGGLALTLTELLASILAGLLLFTGGFFAAHSIGSGWTG